MGFMSLFKSKRSRESKKKKRSKSESGTHQQRDHMEQQDKHGGRSASAGASSHHGNRSSETGRPRGQRKVSFHEDHDSEPRTMPSQQVTREPSLSRDVGDLYIETKTPTTTPTEETQRPVSYDVTRQQQVTSVAGGTYRQIKQEPELHPGHPQIVSDKKSHMSYTEKQEQDRLAEMMMSGGPINIMAAPANTIETKVHQKMPEKSDSAQLGQDRPKETSLVGPQSLEVYVTADEMTEKHFFYKMNHPRRGVALIFNIGEFLPITGMKRRNGYEVDGELMKGTFTRLGFDVLYHADVTSKQLLRGINKVADSFHGDDDCFACVIMTHGNRSTSDLIFTKDGMLTLDFIVERFNGANCPTLAGKPKMFFVQACRGDQMDPGQEVPYADEDFDQTDASSKVRKIPIEADILLSQATTPGYLSFRNSGRGSIYIRCLTKALGQYGFEEDLLTVLTRVSAMVAFEFESNSSSQPAYSGKKQMPSFTSQLTKRLCFSAPPKYLT